MTDPVECIDVLSPNGTLTGKIETRENVHQKGLWHRTVHVWVVSPDQRILLQKRAMGKKVHPGLWDMACAGHLSSGESSIEAAVKECREELGITLSPEDLTFLFTMKHEGNHNNGKIIDREFHDIYLVIKNIPLSCVTLQTDEVSDISYVSLFDFKGRVHGKDPELVPHYDEFMRIVDYLLT